MEGQDTEWDEGPEEWAVPGHGSPEHQEAPQADRRVS